MNIGDSLSKITAVCEQHGATLVAVCKTHPVESVLEAYEWGQRDFGENKVQDLIPKYEALPKDIRWHFIGHLQRNKVKLIAPFVHLIHGVDSLRLLQEIEKQGEKLNRTLSCLIQVHISSEETKFGFSPEDARHFLLSLKDLGFSHVSVQGLMGMATFTEDEKQIKKEFSVLRALFEEFSGKDLGAGHSMSTLSTGMTGDYPLALEEGSTMVRIGTRIFGPRKY